jgi:uncharacterized protein
MNPLFFGSSDSPLYGVYHPPKARQGRKSGVVLCCPFGQEYMRAHRAFRQLSLLLSKAGFHVFRFDYTGSGDSWGESDAFSLARAAEDTGLAVDELRDTAEVEQVAILGLRLGGTIAARTAIGRDDVSHLILWDAIESGAGYLAELSSRSQAGHGPTSEAIRMADGTISVMGFPVSDTMQQELRALSVSSEPSPRCAKALVVADALGQTSARLEGWCRSGGSQVTALEAPLPGRWDEVDNWGSAMIPQEAIQTIVGWMTSEVK